MHKSDKERLVSELTERLKTTRTLMVADYRGLTVTDIDKLRGELLEHGARFQVVKNTLTRRAAEEAGADALLALLDGPTAIAFLETDGDPVAVAKALSNAARDTKVLQIRGGILEGTTIDEAEIKNLATLPPAEVLRAQVVSAVAGPLMMVVGLFAAPLREFVSVLDARIKQLEEQGETVPEPQAAAEEAAPEEAAPEEAAPEEAAPEEAASEELGSEEPAPEEPVAEGAAAEEPTAETEEAPVEEVSPEAPAAEAAEPEPAEETTERAQEE
jgi:large subunit ribosomal protein L10